MRVPLHLSQRNYETLEAAFNCLQKIQSEPKPEPRLQPEDRERLLAHSSKNVNVQPRAKKKFWFLK